MHTKGRLHLYDINKSNSIRKPMTTSAVNKHSLYSFFYVRIIFFPSTMTFFIVGFLISFDFNCKYMYVITLLSTCAVPAGITT